MSANKNINTTISRIPTNIETNFFQYWVEFLRPFNKLTDRELGVLAELLKSRYELSKVITDEKVIDTVVLSMENRADVRKKLKLSSAHFNSIIKKLRDTKVITNNRLNPKVIPRITADTKSFRFILYFDFK